MTIFTRLRAKLFGMRRVRICAACKHVKFGAIPHLAFCHSPQTAQRNLVTNELEQPFCSVANRRGNCRAFEEK